MGVGRLSSSMLGRGNCRWKCVLESSTFGETE